MSDARLTPDVSADDHVQGPDDAPVTLVEYGDFECSYCGMAYPIVKSIQKRLGARLRFVFRHFPLREAHPHAQHAAESAEGAAAQGRFWEMHDALYQHQHALDDASLLGYAAALGLDEERLARELAAGEYVAPVRADFRSGVRSGVNGTPTFFVNGVRYDAAWNDEGAFLKALQRLAS